MIVHFGLDLLRPEWQSATVCVGVYDGVHRGHQQVISTAVNLARTYEQPCILTTFDRHPAWVVAPDRVPLPLATLAQNLDQFERLGVSATIVLPFDRTTADTTAEQFLSSTLRDKLRAERLVVGHDFALGKGREGTGPWLKQRIETMIVPPFELEGHRVSSSEIRNLVQTGSVEKAALFLGRPFSLRGVVVPGAKLGRTLGFPTANLALAAVNCLPTDGVYGGWCETPFGRFMAAIGVGMRPTVSSMGRTIEAYLLDYPGESLYGATLDLGFSVRIRDELAFDSLEDLAAAMGQDLDRVRHSLVA